MNCIKEPAIQPEVLNTSLPDYSEALKYLGEYCPYYVSRGSKY